MGELVSVDGELFGDTLPTYLTRFIGRDLEIRAVQSLMSSSRLVTVCGVGGAGKTRLAIEVAQRTARHRRPRRTVLRCIGCRWLR